MIRPIWVEYSLTKLSKLPFVVFPTGGKGRYNLPIDHFEWKKRWQYNACLFLLKPPEKSKKGQVTIMNKGNSSWTPPTLSRSHVLGSHMSEGMAGGNFWWSYHHECVEVPGLQGYSLVAPKNPSVPNHPAKNLAILHISEYVGDLRLSITPTLSNRQRFFGKRPNQIFQETTWLLQELVLHLPHVETISWATIWTHVIPNPEVLVH